MSGVSSMALLDRVLARCVEGPGGCWTWTGPTTKGYSYICANGRNYAGHRLAYEVMVADIPDGLHIDHLCRVRNCVNPMHLEPVTPRVNVQRGISPVAVNMAQVTCKRGHEFDYVDGRGKRECKTCDEIRHPRAEPRTHCVNGHELTPDNLYVRSNGHRECRTCRKALRPARRTGAS